MAWWRVAPNIRLIGIPAEQLDGWRARVEPLMDRLAVWLMGRWHASDVFDRIASRDMQLWVVMRGEDLRGIIVTEIVVYPRKVIGFVFGVAGVGIREWLHARDTLHEWAKANGCVEMQGYGRFGWQRLLSDYKAVRVIYTRDV